MNAPLNLAWHHVIPSSILRDVWNTLVDRYTKTQLPESQLAVRQFLALCRRRQTETDSWLAGMRANALGIVQCTQIAEMVKWPPWDIVEGPAANMRADDPGDQFMDRFTAGLTTIESSRMRSVEALFRDFSFFLARAPGVSAFDLKNLADAATRHRNMVACEEPIPFREAMWLRGSDGLWKKQR